jgi:hypothetical protein
MNSVFDKAARLTKKCLQFRGAFARWLKEMV